MAANRRYDGELQMFVEEAREPSQQHLEFLKWLRDKGRLGLRSESANEGNELRNRVIGSEEDANVRSFAFRMGLDGRVRVTAEMGGLARDAGRLDGRAELNFTPRRPGKEAL